MRIVPGYGRMPNDVLLVGESPGINEFKRQEPFVGKSGAEQEWYLRRHNLTARSWYKTNVVKEFKPGNPDPTAEQVEYWSSVLQAEVDQCRPKLIVAVGRFAAQWFLGEGLKLDKNHGIPHKAGAFNPNYADRAPCPVIPIYHPASGFYEVKMRTYCMWDYDQVAAAIKRIQSGQPILVAEDLHDGKEDYRDATGHELKSLLEAAQPDIISLDTEGIPDNPWSLQVSWQPGTGYVLRCEQPDFALGINALQPYAKSALWVIHNAMYDIEMCRVMGFELCYAKVWDSMYAAYIMRLEPQGLKPLAWRWCGVKMESYLDTIGYAGISLQLDYLRQIVDYEFDRPEPITTRLNNGELKTKQPQSISKTAKRIINDVESGKTTKDGPTNPWDRWKKVDEAAKSMAEDKFGEMPFGSLANIPLDKAIYYSARDSDAALRVYSRLSQKLDEMGLTQLMNDGMEVLPIFEQIQYNGMPASRSKFQSLHDQMDNECFELVHKLSTEFFNGEPINPKSTPQVRELMELHGIEGLEDTDSGEVSTGKKSIEYMRGKDPAITTLFDWKDRQHIRDTFCKAYLKHIPEHVEIHPVRCQVNTTRVETRRLSTKKPNLLAVSARSELGIRVRHCFVAPPGQVFGSWDFSNIEVRFMAHESQDPLLIDFFLDELDRDFHSEKAALLFNKPIERYHGEMSKEAKIERAAGKETTFSGQYGISPHGLMLRLRMKGIDYSEKDCGRLLAKDAETYSGVTAYKKRIAEEVAETGMIQDHWSMIRYLPGIWDKKPSVRAEAARHAVSHRIQGGAQGMIQQAMKWLKYAIKELQDQGHNIEWRLQLHDEVLLTFDEYLWPIIDPIVRTAFVEHCGIKLLVPVKAEGCYGKTWGDCK